MIIKVSRGASPVNRLTALAYSVNNVVSRFTSIDGSIASLSRPFPFAQVVLSACSSYFQKLLLSNPCKHPTIIMPQDVCFNDLKFIIEFVYRGEIDVSQAELQVSLGT